MSVPYKREDSLETFCAKRRIHVAERCGCVAACCSVLHMGTFFKREDDLETFCAT